MHAIWNGDELRNYYIHVDKNKDMQYNLLPIIFFIIILKLYLLISEPYTIMLFYLYSNIDIYERPISFSYYRIYFESEYNLHGMMHTHGYAWIRNSASKYI